MFLTLDSNQTGHSLGAALSMLDALYFRLRLPLSVRIGVRTFGSPRVGDDDFVKFFNSKVRTVIRSRTFRQRRSNPLLGFRCRAREQ
jgi:predicted lipase